MKWASYELCWGVALDNCHVTQLRRTAKGWHTPVANTQLTALLWAKWTGPTND